ncbi:MULTISPECIES: conjugal transfer protein [Bacillaceae]|uniref:Conjugal transfer protein n=1 Tax=Alkalicoccobacillus plakortidis TaxID=444060 RepID=A0A9D5DN27_9BACI|nr:MULTISPECIES: conjugal transfer protein [Bacillaceae]KQL56970.1 hypothetical protein AN965_10935 [Alkalicoccobacillus plakortidis]
MAKSGGHSIIERLKHRFKRIKKPAKQRSMIRKDHSKRTATAVWSLLGSIVVLSLLTILLSVNTRSALNETNAHLSSEANEEESPSISLPAAEQYLSGFIDVFINVENTHETLEERKQTLKNYMAQSATLQDDKHPLYQLSDLQGNRILENHSLFNMREKEEETLFQYKVTFTNQVPKEKEVEIEPEDDDDEPDTEIVIENEEAKQTLLLNIPVIAEESTFAIAGTPYFSEVYSLNGTIRIEEEKSHIDPYVGEEQSAVQEFLHSFFERYAAEPKEELAYMMKEPESLNGALSFEEIQDVKLIEVDNGFKAEVAVMFRGKGTNIPQPAFMELEINRHEGNYYIESMDYQ